VIAGIIGLTLPFSVYVALTSFMAFLANPFVLVLLLTGFLSFITKKSNKKIRNAFLPNLVSQIAISSTIGEPSIDKLNKLVKFYEV
jgi:predicted PurR-regulated permease PerM